MKSLNNYIRWMDSNTLGLLKIRAKSDEDLMSLCEGDEKIFKAFREGKCGLIRLHKISDNPGIEKGKEYYGITTCFSENLAVFVSSPDIYFHSSVIKEIDWKNNQFKTLNSVYAFTFEELDDSEVLDSARNLYNHESENKDNLA